jgi:mannose-6-phosphate isomerase-like protein (cupin superfamily)
MGGCRLRSGAPSTSSPLGKAQPREHHRLDGQAGYADPPARIIRTSHPRVMSEGKCSVEAREQGISEAVVYILPGEGSRSLRVFGELVVYKTKSERTGGAYSLFEVVTQPENGPPPHVQHREDESFYVLEGEYEFFAEGRILRAAAGSLVYVPRGNLHAHKNVGEGVGRMLVSQTPGGLHERLFE